MHLKDRIGSPVTLDEVVKFRQCVRECQVMEMNCSGPFSHGQTKKKGCREFFLKIDRVFNNVEWLNKFESVAALYLPESISNHSPSLIKLTNT